MRKTTLLAMAATAVLAVASLASASDDPVILWRQIVGIIPAGNVVGSGTGAVMGGFAPWTTTSGVARVNLATGVAQFLVHGLVFAGTNFLGTPGPVTEVKGTLICDVDGSAGGGNSVLVETPAVPLSATGDAHFSGSLGSLPSVCQSGRNVAFVIRAAAFAGNPVPSGPWIANGAVLVHQH